eukprot:GHVU01221418.1.p3 GENE.GHVU01221418.1~~GHVU01221418.1.p3  ORF type:complete len:122 (+),score=1.24 GHVU01221418.1:66-431(+)
MCLHVCLCMCVCMCVCACVCVFVCSPGVSDWTAQCLHSARSCPGGGGEYVHEHLCVRELQMPSWVHLASPADPRQIQPNHQRREMMRVATMHSCDAIVVRGVAMASPFPPGNKSVKPSSIL